MPSPTRKIAIRTSRNTMTVVLKTGNGRIRVWSYLWTTARRGGERHILHVLPDALNKINCQIPSRLYRFDSKTELLQHLSSRFGSEVVW